MQTKTSLRGIKERIVFHRLLGVSCASLAVFALAFILVPTLISEASATNLSVGAAWNTVSLTLDPDVAATSGAADPAAEQALPTHGDILFGDIVPTSIDVTTGSIGTMRVIKKTLGIESTGQYYSVYLSMVGDSNRLLLNNTNMYIESITGTWDNPASFSTASWGYAVPTGNSTDGTFITPFSSPAIYGNYDSLLGRDLTKTGTGSSVYNTGTWAAIPANDGDTAPQQIWKATTENINGFGGEAGDNVKNKFDIYFATIIDTNVMAGTYENSVVYTAIASSASLDSVSNNVSRSLEYVGEGSEEILSFDLSASTSTITQNQIKVYLIPHHVVERSNYTLTNDYDSYKVATNTCTVTNLATTSAGATVTCTLPASPNGIDDGIMTEDAIVYNEGEDDEETVAIQKGEFDFWINIEDYGYNYISRYTKELEPIASIVYAGLQSKDKDGGTYITEMQQMTGAICRNTNMWGHLVNTSVRDDARIYDFQGEQLSDGVITATPLANTSQESVTIGLGTFLLGDNRETVTNGGQTGTQYKTYLVRRLADGNCWMVQNLDLNLRNFAGTSKLTPTNTDLSSTRAYWDPAKTMRDAKTYLEPGELASNLLVSEYQFQARNQFGAQLFWGSRYQAGSTEDNVGEANNGNLVITNNINAQFPRSYNNDLAYYKGDDYTMSGPTAHVTNTSTSIMGDDGTNDFQDTIWQPQVLNSGLETTDGTMRGTRYFGDYYNYYAATAETGSYGATTFARDSICPKGWRLPPGNTGYPDKSWSRLIVTTYKYIDSSSGEENAATAASIRRVPISLNYSGVYNYEDGSLGERGTRLYAWTGHSSSTIGYTLSAYGANSMNTRYTSTNAQKTRGFIVRCVARD